ncbi:MAG TPA: putative quinol monooxygenase [Verrucomicrobiae bacterium]|jgi:quinol monooxygenase YgiN
MNTNQVTLVAAFQARPGKEAELRQTLLALVPLTRKEEGCINYDLHVSADDPAKLMFYENWITRAHLNKHGETPHIQNLHSRMDELCTEPVKLTFWQKIG